MGITYFGGKTWGEVSREERYFCAELCFSARENLVDFVTLLATSTKLDLDPNANWDLGYEVCLYRDIIARGLSASHRHDRKFSLKRTFDLCLFSDSHIVVIEAKAYESFTAKQAAHFESDLRDIPALLGRPVQVSLVALASSRYFAAFDKFGRSSALKPFKGARLTWAQLAIRYNNPAFDLAEGLYKH
jgi:hypothetical protein